MHESFTTPGLDGHLITIVGDYIAYVFDEPFHVTVRDRTRHSTGTNCAFDVAALRFVR